MLQYYVMADHSPIITTEQYVAVETVENIYMVSPLFASFYLHADSLKNHLVAIGVVDPAQMLAFLAQRRSRWPDVRTEADVARLVNDTGKEGRRLRQEVVESLMAHGRAKKLNGYELVKGIHLCVPSSSEVEEDAS